MAKESSGSSRTTVPKDYPVIPPSPSPSESLNAFILPLIVSVQKELGQLTQAVSTLTEDSREQRKKLDRISHIMYAVGVVGTILLGLLVFLANKIADATISLLRASGH